MPRGRHEGFKLKSVRLGLLKVKPSLRDSIFKGLHFWQWSCLFGHVCEISHVPMFCLFWEVSVNIRLPIKRSLRPMTLVDCFGTYSKKSSSKKLSHLQLSKWTEPQQLSHLQQLESQNLSQQLSQNISQQFSQKLINSHTYSAAKHCSSHSHTILAVHLHILMSGKGLLTLYLVV